MGEVGKCAQKFGLESGIEGKFWQIKAQTGQSLQARFSQKLPIVMSSAV
jgi:hypothetical protein